MAYIMEGECLMSEFQVYKDLAERTGGEFYLGICGPVRTGKSTFIKRFMETLVTFTLTFPILCTVSVLYMNE